MNFRFLFLALLIVVGASASVSAAEKSTFACNKGVCSCHGGDNCGDMRKANACNDNLNCSAKDGETFCTCTQKAKIQGTEIKVAPPAGKSLK